MQRTRRLRLREIVRRFKPQSDRVFDLEPQDYLADLHQGSHAA